VTTCSRVVCAVEPSPAGLDVLERARRLVAPGGELVAVTVFDPAGRAATGWEGPATRTELRAVAEEVHLEAAARLALSPGQRAVLRDGLPLETILREVRMRQADLLAVGSRGHGRASGVVFGSASTMLLRHAPCPVVLVHPVGPPFRFPRTVVVGVDGSRQSLEALALGRELASRLEVPLRPIVATGGKPVDLDGLVGIQALEWLEGGPVEALAGAAGGEDLLVVGSRGLHGLRALGSVSERLAHRAACSVLVVRPLTTAPAAPAAAAMETLA
jgi:nucleotide-binding universal stress UspA family protein